MTSRTLDATYADALRLNDGTRVRYPVDLLPVVASDSRAATAIHESRSAASLGNALTYGGLAALVSGLVVSVASLASAGPRDLGAPFYGGVGLGVGGLLTLLVGQGYGAKSDAAGIEAMKHYDEGLLRKLDLCPDDQAVSPCR
jgi:hypothetical protein